MRKTFSSLTDERLGKLFRGSDNLRLASSTDQQQYALDVSESDYQAKSNIFNSFMKDLFSSNVELVI